MSAAHSEAVLDRVAQRRREGAEEFAAYAFLVFGILGFQAPEVLEFVMDRADMMLPPPTSEATP
jgi:hypothetical protein